MTTGYYSAYGGAGGIDLDQIFELGSTGGQTGFVAGYDGGGQDLASLFAPRANGTDIGYDTGFIALDGRDLRHWFAKKGSVVSDYARGTLVPGAGGSTQYGYWTGNFGSWSPTLQVVPLNFFYFFATYNDTTIAFGGALPGDPAQIIATCGGYSLNANRLSAGNYATPAVGDAFHLSDRQGQSLDLVIAPYP